MLILEYYHLNNISQLMKKIILKNHHKKYFLLQRNAYLSDFQKVLRKKLGRYLFTNLFVNYFNPIKNINNKLNKDFKLEFDAISKFFPKEVDSMLDIGSGLGIIDIFISYYFNNNLNITLIDKNRIEKKVSYGFNAKGQFYNNFDLTLDFLKSNGLDDERIDFVDADSKDSINKNFDLVISLLSMGYHYPINQYLKMLRSNTNKNTVFIFDIADEYTGLDLIKNTFGSVDIIYKSKEIRHNYLRVCCKYLKS